MNDAELIALFWEAIPQRVEASTQAWLAVEQGDREALQELRRILHSIKGEAQMFSLELCAHIAEALEDVVDELVRGAPLSTPTGNLILGALEVITVLPPGALADDELQRIASSSIEELLKARDELRSEAPSAAEAGPSSDPTVSGNEVGSREEQQISAARLDPLVTELRRLYSTQAILYPQLLEVRKMIRDFLREIDPKAPPARLAEAVVKTLGFGKEIDGKLNSLLSAWSTTEYLATATLDQIETVMRDAAIVPLSRIASLVERTARSAAQSLEREVQVSVLGEASIDGALERRLRPALLHLVRNAVDHGIEPVAEREALGKPSAGELLVDIRRSGNRIIVTVGDDGRGIDFEQVRAALAQGNPNAGALSQDELVQALFRHGFSTRETASSISGRGVGLDVVYREVTSAGGTLNVESVLGQGSRFVLSLPDHVQIDTVMPVTAHGAVVAIPSHVIETVTYLSDVRATPKGAIARPESGDGEFIPVRSLSTLFGFEREVRSGDLAVLVRTRRALLALVIDGYRPPRALVTQPSVNSLIKTPHIQGVAPTPNGDVLLVLDVDTFAEASPHGFKKDAGPAGAEKRTTVLVCEDGPVARELLVGLLRSFGMRAVEAMDGADGLEQARRDPPDLILTDIEMPVMDGLTMVEELRKDERFVHTPVVILSTREDEPTRKRAKSLNVSEFLSKRKFERHKLEVLVRRLLSDG
ncbi:MAG: response regulator [Myxococcota bacterium]